MSLPYYPCHENKISTPDTHSGTRPDLELLKILSKQDEESEECWSPPSSLNAPLFTRCSRSVYSSDSLTLPPSPMIRTPAQSHPTPDDVCGTPWSRRSRVFARCSSAMHYPLTCFIAQVVQSWLASWILRTRIPLTTALTCKAPRQTCKLPTDNTPAFRKLSKLIRFFPSSTHAWEIWVHILQNSVKNYVQITHLYCV